MSQSSSEKFLYFTVGLLKGSAALDALRQDATKHHMVDQPGQLIALRITEYYEMMNQGIVQPVVRVPAILLSPEADVVAGSEQVTKTEIAVQPQPAPISTSAPSLESEPESALSQLSGKMRALRNDHERVISVSPAAEKNADEAADYWSAL